MYNKIIPGKLTKSIKEKALSQRAADIIRDMIIAGKCPPGSRITETDFAEALAVSRISIREAFLILENEGLVNRVANKYTEIAVFTEKDIEDIYVLRTGIELACLETCIRKNLLNLSRLRKQVRLIDNIPLAGEDKDVLQWVKEDLNFHELIILQSANARALKIWNSLKNQIKTLLCATLERYPDTIRFDKTESHYKIFSMIENQKFDEAAAALKNHIMNGCSDVIQSSRFR